MARTTGTESLRDLVDRGALQANEELVVRRKSKPPIVGSLTSRGTIKVGNREYETPTLAAKEELHIRSANGWQRWRVPRLDDATLEDVRKSQ